MALGLVPLDSSTLCCVGCSGACPRVLPQTPREGTCFRGADRTGGLGGWGPEGCPWHRACREARGEHCPRRGCVQGRTVRRRNWNCADTGFIGSDPSSHRSRTCSLGTQVSAGGASGFRKGDSHPLTSGPPGCLLLAGIQHGLLPLQLGNGEAWEGHEGEPASLRPRHRPSSPGTGAVLCALHPHHAVRTDCPAQPAGRGSALGPLGDSPHPAVSPLWWRLLPKPRVPLLSLLSVRREAQG